MRTFKHRIEAALLWAFFAVFRLLPLDAASALGGFLARTIGPFLSAHKTAVKNLSMIFPELAGAQKNKLISDMWDNLGRVAAEMPRLPGKKLFSRIVIRGGENIPRDGNQVIFFSGHLGNWELLSSVAYNNGVPLTVVYRKANNPYVDAMIGRIRATQSADMFPKGPRGAVKMVRSLKRGQSMAMLVDQKMNDGIAVPFFGRDAMTAPAIAELALRYNIPLIPARVIRTHGVHFEATVYPPLAFTKTGEDEKDVLAIMTLINQQLETWIRETPAQWFWVHKRWPNA